jgi:hypothetical protein
VLLPSEDEAAPAVSFGTDDDAEAPADDDSADAWQGSGSETGWETGMLAKSSSTNADLADLKATLDGLQSRLQTPVADSDTSAASEPAGEPSVESDGETGDIFGRRAEDGSKTTVDGDEDGGFVNPNHDPDAVMDAVSKLRKLWGTD